MRSLLRKCLICISVLLSFSASAETPGSSKNIETQVKAAYLYQFVKYVEWPDGTFPRQDNPIVIGVVGADALADEIEHTVAGQTANGRPVVTRRLKPGDSLRGLQVLFIGRLEKAHLLEIFTEAKSKPLLTVTESEEAHTLGSMINFVVIDDRLRFEVALGPVGLGRLKISARMLTAASKVTQGAS